MNLKLDPLISCDHTKMRVGTRLIFIHKFKPSSKTNRYFSECLVLTSSKIVQDNHSGQNNKCLHFENGSDKINLENNQVCKNILGW